MSQLTVVMPAYNEEDCIRQAVDEVRQEVLAIVPGSRLLVVDDGSRDGTGAILDEIARMDPRVEILHKTNGGHGDSILAGAGAASSEYLFLLDSDRQIPLKNFARHWAMRGPDVLLCGVRQKRHDPTHRLVLTRLVRLAARILFGCSLSDANVPYKIVPRPFWIQAAGRMPAGSLTPSLLLAIVAARDPAMRVVEVPVEHLPRRSGKVSLVSWRLLRFCGRAAVQLIRLRIGWVP